MSTWSPSRDLEQPARPAGYEVADPAAARLRGTGGFPTHPDVALYDRLGQSLAYLATLGLAVLLWAVGAYFTLRFLDAWDVGARLQQLAGALGWPLSAAGGWWLTLLALVALTTIEAFLMPPLPLLGGAARTRTRAQRCISRCRYRRASARWRCSTTGATSWRTPPRSGRARSGPAPWMTRRRAAALSNRPPRCGGDRPSRARTRTGGAS